MREGGWGREDPEHRSPAPTISAHCHAPSRALRSRSKVQCHPHTPNLPAPAGHTPYSAHLVTNSAGGVADSGEGESTRDGSGGGHCLPHCRSLGVQVRGHVADPVGVYRSECTRFLPRESSLSLVRGGDAVLAGCEVDGGGREEGGV